MTKIIKVSRNCLTAYFCKNDKRKTAKGFAVHNASGSLMTVTCKFVTSINVSCLHFGQ